MAISGITDSRLIYEAIEFNTRQRVQAVLEEEIAAANKRVADRVRGEADRIALQILSHYSIEQRGAEVVIRVGKFDK